MKNVSALVIACSLALVKTALADFAAYTGVYIEGYTGNEVEDFPVLVKISESKLPGVYSAVKHDGADLKFTDADGNGSYPFEVDTWDPSGISYVWVRLPSFSSTTKFRMYYGDNSITQNNSATDVWDGYDLVCHLNESVVDSSPNGVLSALNDIQVPSVVTGMIGKGYSHASSGLGPVFANYIYPGHGYASEELPDGVFTVSCWFMNNGEPTKNARLFNVVDGPNSYFAYADPRGKINFSPGKGCGNFTSSKSGVSVADDTWTKLDVIYNGTTISAYVNGESWGSGPVTGSARCGYHPWITWGGTGYVGKTKDVLNFGTANDSANIRFDECRIHDLALSQDWIAADYFVVANDACSFGSGPVEPRHGTVIIISGTIGSSGGDDSGDDGDDDNPVQNLALPWNVQFMTPQDVVIQYDGYNQIANNPTSSDISYLNSLTSTLMNGTYSVTGKGVTLKGHAIQAQGQMSFKDANGHNEMVGNWNGLWQIRPVYNIYVHLDSPLQDGVENTLVLPDNTQQKFVYHADDPLPIFKVNQVGYLASAAEKYVYLGGWQGTGGALALNNSYNYEIVNKASGAIAGSGTFVNRVTTEPKYGNVPLAGEKTLEADISSLTAEGEYYIRVSGLGRSMDFRVSDSAAADQFAVHMNGLYMHRCGCAKTEPYTHFTDAACHQHVYRGVHPANDDEYTRSMFDANGVMLTNNNASSGFEIIGANRNSCNEELELIGGWHDAADYDRRPYHLSIVTDLAVVYLLKPENFTDGQLAVPEQNNGIPDILDEAIWGIKYLLQAQDQETGAVGGWCESWTHPTYADKVKPSGDSNLLKYYIGFPTRRSTLKYCGAAALLARALYAADTPQSRAVADVYKASAVKAWNYALNGALKTNVALQGNNRVVTYNERNWYDPYEYVRAAVNLGEITGDASYFGHLDDTILYHAGGNDNGGWGDHGPYPVKNFFTVNWSILSDDESLGRDAFVLGELAVPSSCSSASYTTITNAWCNRVVNHANAMVTQMSSTMAYRIPWWGTGNNHFPKMSWGAVVPLRRAMWLCAAHSFTKNPQYLRAAQLACDFQSGCNPKGATWTSGLGKVYPVKFLNLHSFADDIDEYIYGVTPFYNTYNDFSHVANRGKTMYSEYANELNAKPIFRRWEPGENMSVSISEYTVTQTIGPCAATMGYLIDPSHTAANLNWKQPADDIRKLPGYWALP